MDQFTPSPVVKGKRTKRPRPPAAAPASPSFSSPELSSSSSSTTTTEEEEDMANCLILLAQGRALDQEIAPATEKVTRSRPVEAAGGGLDVYQCKTCNKCFLSFQALGGHCTSHKKPKTTAASVLLDEGNKPPAADSSSASKSDLAAAPDSHNAAASATTAAGSSRARVHECSICGSEFSSGQALGGHMRRHRPIMAVAAPADRAPPPNQSANKEKRLLLSLDLNLPAQPEEDESQELQKSPSAAAAAAAAFPLENRRPPPLVFSVSSLVDCHY